MQRSHLLSRSCSLIGSLLIAFLINANLTIAQQSTTYYCISYYKAVPGKEGELHDMIKNVDAGAQEARIKKGVISGWYWYKLLSPAGSSTDYDYMAVTIIDRYKELFESSYTFDSAMKKTFTGKDARFFSDYYSRLNGTRNLVKEEIYAGLALADSSSKNGFQSRYIISDFMQPKPGKFGEYLKMEIDTFRIIHKERIKLGDISQWGCFYLQLPYDTRTGYSLLCFNFYNDINAIINAKYAEALKNTFPSVDLNRLFQAASSMRDNPRADLWRLEVFAPPSKR